MNLEMAATYSHPTIFSFKAFSKIRAFTHALCLAFATDYMHMWPINSIGFTMQT